MYVKLSEWQETDEASQIEAGKDPADCYKKDEEKRLVSWRNILLNHEISHFQSYNIILSTIYTLSCKV